VGDARFEAQLRRSAALRRLVAGTIEITDEDINQAFAIRHGPRVACRLILVRTNAEAQQIREQLVAAPNLAALFPILARTRSIDASAPRGGALDPISPADPTFPSTIRSALSSIEPGGISPVLAVDLGFAIVLVEDRVPDDNASLDTRREPLRRLLRLQRERVAMETKAEDLIRAARLTILDRRLDWSWRATTSSTSSP
jgi:parvulin-like peptidyl-prolyl isomerase